MSRIANLAPVGSLLKRPRPARKAKATTGPREKDDKHLAAIRIMPCVKCGMEPCGVAAHVRMSSAAHGKPNAGMSVKPDDCWTVPLCDGCHNDQHRLGEIQFWHDADVAPIPLALKLFAASPDVEAMRAITIKTIGDRR